VADFAEVADDADWFLRHPDGRVERMSYVGESKGFVDGK